MEKFYSSKALLKMAGGGMHTPHPPPPRSAPAKVFQDEHQSSECTLEMFMYRLIKRKEVDDTFPNVETALRFANIPCFNDLQFHWRTLPFQVKIIVDNFVNNSRASRFLSKSQYFLQLNNSKLHKLYSEVNTRSFVTCVVTSATNLDAVVSGLNIHFSRTMIARSLVQLLT